MSCLPQFVNRTLLLQCRSIRHWYFATITAYKAQINYMAITLTPPWPQFNAADAQASILQYQYNFQVATLEIENYERLVLNGCDNCIQHLYYQNRQNWKQHKKQQENRTFMSDNITFILFLFFYYQGLTQC